VDGAAELEVFSVNGSGRTHALRFFMWLVPVLLGSIVIPAGRTDAAEQRVSATTVAEGLTTIQHLGEEVAEYAGEDEAKAEEHATKITPVWNLIEGTIKANDQSSYEAFEGVVAGFEAAAANGDSTKAEDALKALAKTSTGYLARFSSDAAAKQTPAPAPANRRTAAAAPGAEGVPAAAEAGDAALARTGPMSDALAALAGGALALGGLAIIGGARRRPVPIG
jgi:hypothetical protein